MVNVARGKCPGGYILHPLTVLCSAVDQLIMLMPIYRRVVSFCLKRGARPHSLPAFMYDMPAPDPPEHTVTHILSFTALTLSSEPASSRCDAAGERALSVRLRAVRIWIRIIGHLQFRMSPGSLGSLRQVSKVAKDVIYVIHL